MPDLAPASTLHLPGMSKAEAHALFIRIVGAERVQAEPDATEQVLQVCAGLPLAVRIAGSRLAARGGWSVRTLADRLSDERRRLDELRTGNLAVRACFEVSYASLPSPAAREAVWPTQAFCLLGLWTGPFISLSAAAALLGRSDAEAMDTLEVLVDAHLLESPTPDLYRFHDLIRVYAAHQGQTQLTESDREAAIERLLTWYLHTAEAAAKIISPMHRRVPLRPHPPEVRPFEFKDLSEALAWCESERAGLTAATSMAAECHMHDLAWKIPAAAMSFNYRRSHWVDLEATGRIGLVSARILGDRPAEAWMLNNLGMAYGLQGNEEAISYFQQSRDICREHHDAREESRATTNLACAFYAFRDYNQARVMAWDSLRQESGSRYAEGLAWNILGAACCALGNPGEGVGHLQKALDIFRELGDKATQATCLTDLGAAHLESDHLTSAREYLKESLMIKQEIGDFDGLATTFWHLGNVERRAGNAATAKEFLTESLQVAKKIGDQKLVADIGANLTAVEDAE